MNSRAIIGVNTSEICPTVRNILLRSTEHNDAIIIRLEKLRAGALVTPENTNKQMCIELVHEMYTHAITKGQLCTYAGNLLLYTTEGLNQLEAIVAKNRSNHRKASRLNRDLKRSTVLIIDRLAELQNILQATKQSGAQWRLMYDLSETEFRLTEAVNETEIWNDSRQYDIMWDASTAGPLAKASQLIIESIQEGSIKEAMEMVNSLEKPEYGQVATFATCLEGIAQVCFEYGHYSESEGILKDILNIRQSVYGLKNNIINATLHCLGLVFAKNNDVQKMNAASTEALSILETETKKTGDVVSLSKQYMRTGSMWFYYANLEEGLALMRLGVTWLASSLPENQKVWVMAAVQFARANNTARQYDEAVAVASKVISRYHESVHKFAGSKIHEIAYSLQKEFDKSKLKNAKREAALTSIASAELSKQMPPPTQLPAVYEQALREVAMGYAGQFEFRAANVIKDYLDSCVPFSSSDCNRLTRRVKFFPKAKDSDVK